MNGTLITCQFLLRSITSIIGRSQCKGKFPIQNYGKITIKMFKHIYQTSEEVIFGYKVHLQMSASDPLTGSTMLCPRTSQIPHVHK